MRIAMTWEDGARRLTLRLAPNSRMLSPSPRRFNVRVAGSTVTAPVVFAGRTVQIRV
jgi:hypothetical protein